MPTKKSLLHCSAAVVRSTLNPPRCPQPSGVLNRLPEASDFSQRVRHLNSVSREAETLTPACAKPATRPRQGYNPPLEYVNGDLDFENLFDVCPTYA